MFYFCLNTNSLPCLLEEHVFSEYIWPKATLREFAISLVLVNSCEPVKVESESRNFSSEFTDGNKKRSSLFQYFAYVYIFIGTSLFLFMGNQTVHEDSNNVTGFKYKYKLS